MNLCKSLCINQKGKVFNVLFFFFIPIPIVPDFKGLNARKDFTAFIAYVVFYIIYFKELNAKIKKTLLSVEYGKRIMH